MLSRNAIRSACAVALVAATPVATAIAQPVDRRTLFTFSAPVSIPGVTLPAGQYLFRLADPTSGAKVVQVLSADGTKPYGLFFSYPAERLEAPTTPEVRFIETPKGTPAAIKTWWYPGQRTGYEFIYPREQARRLAQGTTESVLTTQAQTTTTDETNTQDLARVSASGPDTNLSADATPAAGTPTGTIQPGTVASSSMTIPNPTLPAAAARAGDTPAVTPTQTARNERTRLPRTASPVPAVAAAGLLALAASALLGRRSPGGAR